MKSIAISLFCLLCLQLQGYAQLDIFLKGRTTDYRGSFGNTYSGLGLEAGLTINAEKNVLAGGVHFNSNWLGALPATAYTPELEVYSNTFCLHYGGKATLGKYFHPFAFAVAGFRTLKFSDPSLGESYDPFFNSLTPTFGARAGLQIGGRKWRIEGSIDYLSGTYAKYLTTQSITNAEKTGRPYRDFAAKSLMNNLSVGLGVVYVINWPDWVNPVDE
ncbi:hypothetical protein [Cesiribacter sp. SM1]|uniref:hypothetical protein n=1 Tax=Cesiribacter sp. SM1 TaxID=2861196 RepID=UPI001CD5F3B2|nr:hypothetical protein [Cesiribacter sp. SM1]